MVGRGFYGKKPLKGGLLDLTKFMTPFKKGVHTPWGIFAHFTIDPLRRGGRVAEGGGLLNR